MNDFVLFLAALADPTRLRLLNLMKDGEICVCHLQGVLQSNQPKISRHLAYLKRAGLVEARRDGKWMHYRLKKLESARQKVFSAILRHLQKEPPVKKDARRLKQIRCRPSKYETPHLEPGCKQSKAKPHRLGRDSLRLRSSC